ncbi:MAG: anthranilate phosphoribosyltransferase [Aquificae bacterium]|nr:anthranilate phosphoribosyltransferase [Aquificota bacterium]
METQIVKKLTRSKENLTDLTREEARFFMSSLLGGKLKPLRAFALLTALRIKGETGEELLGFWEALGEFLSFRASADAIDLALNYDGKVKTPYVLPSALFIAISDGLSFTLHGEEGVPTKEGVTPLSVLESMGVRPRRENALSFLSSCGLSFLRQRDFLPSLYALLPMRRELGFRTTLNVIEKFANPFGAKDVIASVFHKPYAEKVGEFLSSAGFRRWAVVRGAEGGIETRTSSPTEVLTPEGSFIFDCEVKGVPQGLMSPKEQALVNEEILALGREDSLRDWAVCTAGLLLLLGGRAKSEEEALGRARELLLSGKPYRCLQKCKQINNFTLTKL